MHVFCEQGLYRQTSREKNRAQSQLRLSVFINSRRSNPAGPAYLPDVDRQSGGTVLMHKEKEDIKNKEVKYKK